MQIRHEYEATPQQVAAMLTNEDFLAEVAREVGASSHEITKTDRGARLHAEIAAPSQARRFVGETLAVNLDLNLNPADAAPITGDVSGEVEKMPAKMKGAATISEGGPGAVVDYDIDLNVSVPLVGRKIEQMAEPEIKKIIDVQQGVGKRYLAEHQ